jgi:signal transduction histidine kinase
LEREVDQERETRIEVISLSVPRAPEGCLVCTNSPFVTGVLTDLSAVLDEAREYQARLQHMSSQVLTAHEEERKRIARELHDDTAQALTSILVRLRLLERSVDDDGVEQKIEELRELTAGALASVRRMAMDMRPAALDDLGLVPALQSYAQKFSERWPVTVTVTVEGIKRRLPPNIELVLYRVVQEALTNVARHAQAKTSKVRLSRRNGMVMLTIDDDGRGFDSGQVRMSEDGGLGLFGMGERLALVGGTLAIQSGPAGTTITARVRVRHETTNNGGVAT